MPMPNSGAELMPIGLFVKSIVKLYRDGKSRPSSGRRCPARASLILGFQGPDKFTDIGVNGRCGPADYSKSVPVGRIGKLVRLRGLYVGRMEGPVDFAVPEASRQWLSRRR